MSDIWKDLTDSTSVEQSQVEMDKKYHNTFLVLVSGGNNHIVRYESCIDGYYLLRDKHGGVIKLHQETKEQLILQFPERKVFNHHNGAYEFIRLPYRQYRRGICRDNARISHILGRKYSMDWNAISPEFGNIYDALYTYYPSNIDVAEHALRSGWNSIALNDRFSISLSPFDLSDTMYLWYLDKMIGVIEKRTIIIKHQLFKQEVLDNLKLFVPYKVEF